VPERTKTQIESDYESERERRETERPRPRGGGENEVLDKDPHAVNIDKDVVRTDRTHAFFKDEDGEHLTWMREILLTYTFYNFDLGYCQGMSDLLGPILTIMNDEVDGFWCFAGMMESMVRVGHGHDCHHDTTPQPHHTALQPHPHPTTH